MSLLRRLGIFSIAIALTSSLVGCASEFTVGAIISESGAAGSHGQMVRRGMELALDEVNESGEVGTMKIEFHDDASNAQAGEQIAREMISRGGISAIIGPVSSPVAIAVADVAQANQIPMLSPSASSPELSDKGMYIFRNFPSDVLEGNAMAGFAREIGLETVAIFASEDAYGRGLRNIFTEKFESKYRKIVGEFDYVPGDTDKIAQMAREVTELDPNGIYIVGYEDDVAALLRGLEAAGNKSVLMSTSATTQRVINRAGSAAEKLIYSVPAAWDPASTTPLVSSFVKKFEARYGEAPDIYSAHGYDAVKLIAAAVAAEGGSHPQNVYIGLTSLRDFEGVAGRTEFDKNGDVTRFPKLYVVSDGRAVPFDDYSSGGGSVFRR